VKSGENEKLKKKGVAALGEKDRLYINQGHASGR
jgi:hypothetical protein